MMNEFNNRIDAQRIILSLVNSRRWNEELYGLSRAAIERWMQANALGTSSGLVLALYDTADKLFFLANKSQEQVTQEYRFLEQEVSGLTARIADLMSAG